MVFVFAKSSDRDQIIYLRTLCSGLPYTDWGGTEIRKSICAKGNTITRRILAWDHSLNSLIISLISRFVGCQNCAEGHTLQVVFWPLLVTWMKDMNWFCVRYAVVFVVNR